MGTIRVHQDGAIGITIVVAVAIIAGAAADRVVVAAVAITTSITSKLLNICNLP